MPGPKDIRDKFDPANANWSRANGLRNTVATCLIHLWMQCLPQRRDLERLLVAVERLERQPQPLHPDLNRDLERVHSREGLAAYRAIAAVRK